MERKLDRNFFTQIQGKFSALSGAKDSPDFQGRYLAHVIEVIAQHQPALIPLIVGGGNAQMWCTSEYVFAPGGRADLAIFSKKDDRPYALVEVKAADIHNREHNQHQLRQYANWASVAPGRKVIYLTQLPLPVYMRSAIAKQPKLLRERSVGSVASLVREHSALRKSELVRNLLEYLYFEGLALTPLQPSEIAALHTFMGFSFLPHISGHRRLTSTERVADGPKVFATIVQNWQLVSANRADTLRKHNGVEVPRPTVRYVASPLYEPGTELASQDHESYESKLGGTWWIYSRSVLSPIGGRNLMHEYGLELTVSKRERDDKSPPISARVYSSFYHSGNYFGYASRSLTSTRGKPTTPYIGLASVLGDEGLLSKKLGNVIDASFVSGLRESQGTQAKELRRTRAKILAE